MTAPVSATGSTATHTASSSVDRPDQMGKDTFLKLLVAQMRYQDPANPASSSEMMAQTATMAQVEKLDMLATQNAAMLVLQEHSTAGAMVGKTVSYTDTTGATKSGVVSSVRLASSNSEAVATVDGLTVPVGRITAVSTTPTTTTPTPTPTTPTA
jgi:flagellar basal-body rod modification protein FlgD